MEGKLYIKKFIRDDGETLSFDGEEIYLAENNTLLVRANPATTAVEYTESDGGEMIRQRNATYVQTIKGLIVPKTSTYWDLETRLSLFFKINHTYKIIYVKKDGSMFAISDAWISMGLQIVPVPHETYSEWSIDFTIGNNGWREYMEDESGKEIYANNVVLPLISAASGGEVWESVEGEEISGEGSTIVLDDTKNGATISDLKIKGDTEQQTYTGKNLLPPTQDFQETLDSVSIDYSAGVFTIDGTSSTSGAHTATWRTPISSYTIQSGDYWHYNNDFSSQQMLIQIRFTDNTTLAQAITVVNRIVDMSNYVGKTIKDMRLYFQGGHTFSGTMSPMIVNGVSTATAYEPYVGGVPAPNPNYPQDIHVVTGEQTVKIGGKNLWGGYTTYARTSSNIDFSTNSDGSISMFGTASATAWSATGQVAYQNGAYITLPAGTYYLSTKESVPIGVTPQIVETTSSSNVRDGLGSFTLSKTTNVAVRLKVDSGTSFTTTTTIYPMIEIGSTATTYQPYQLQSYTIDLGLIELAKIGTYQDYIYKSGADWYIHKATGKLVFTGESTEGWSLSSSGNFFLTAAYSDVIQVNRSIVGPIISNYYSATSRNNLADAIVDYGIGVNYDTPRIYIRNKDISNANDFKTWLSSHNTVVYYALSTPTDTKITDNTLIGELEALAAATGYNGQTIITASPSGTNLPAILAVTMQNPTISGEVWDNVGTEWEMGNGGVQTINIASTQAIYPVWVVEGPCINPKLQNNTTDTIAEFDGTVATGQTLTVDFEAGTAYLDSALVTRYVVGIVSFAPGENMAGFNSDGGATQESTISWNNIIN